MREKKASSCFLNSGNICWFLWRGSLSTGSLWTGVSSWLAAWDSIWHLRHRFDTSAAPDRNDSALTGSECLCSDIWLFFFLKDVIIHEAHTSACKDEKKRCTVSTAETLNSVNLTWLTWCQATWHTRCLYSQNSLMPLFSQLNANPQWSLYVRNVP